MLLQLALFHSVLKLSNIPLCVHIYIYIYIYIYIHTHTHLFICSSVEGHLDYFHVLAIVNSAATLLFMKVKVKVA